MVAALGVEEDLGDRLAARVQGNLAVGPGHGGGVDAGEPSAHEALGAVVALDVPADEAVGPVLVLAYVASFPASLPTRSLPLETSS
jgi:hypothetical protein